MGAQHHPCNRDSFTPSSIAKGDRSDANSISDVANRQALRLTWGLCISGAETALSKTDFLVHKGLRLVQKVAKWPSL